VLGSAATAAGEFAIEIDDLYHIYPGNDSPVMNHLHMRVPRGSIYGLLGPSGCGTVKYQALLSLRRQDKSSEDASRTAALFERSHSRTWRGSDAILRGARCLPSPTDVTASFRFTVGILACFRLQEMLSIMTACSFRQRVFTRT
jgi:energy-coupling factor transporter ATP-binding protein EcfA2